MDWFKRKTDKVGEHEVQRRDRRDNEDAPVDSPSPTLLGTGMARKAGEALRKRSQAQKSQLDDVMKDL